MRKFIFPILLILLIVVSARSQWVSNYGGSSSGDINFSSARGNAVTVDASGNCYVTGFSLEEYSGNDIITMKHTLEGDTAWVRSFNGSSNIDDEGLGICVDSQGNVYVVGTAQNTGRSYELTILKYNSEGVLIWNSQYSETPGNRTDKGLAIAVDSQGFIYVTGYSTGNDGFENILTQKYDADGVIIWTRTEDGLYDGNSRGMNIKVDNSGNVCVAGYTADSSSSTDIAVLRYSSDGSLLWVRETSGAGNSQDKAFGIVIDTNNMIYVTGYITASANNTDCYTAMYNPNGSLQWERTYNGNGNSQDRAWGIVNEDDGIYIGGQTTNYNDNTDYLTIKYSSSGEELWVKTYNGTGNGYDAASAIAVLENTDSTKSVVLTGKSWGTDDNYDYTTVRYAVETGSLTSESRYSMEPSTNDIPNGLAVSNLLSRVYVTGFSYLLTETNYEQSYISTMSIEWEKSSELTTENTTAQKFVLHQNYPNPFNPSTTIKFDISSAAKVKLVVYDILGRVVDILVNQDLNAGSYSIMYNNKGLSSGIYFYELTAGSIREIKKMTLVK